jgi:hypothetical protein
MTAETRYILFTRANCHLCDLAAAMLDRAGLRWQPIDIDGDPDLSRRYGIHVPVVRQAASERELFFPFNEKQLQVWANEQK